MNHHLAMFNFKDAGYHAAQIKALDSTDARLAAAQIKVELFRDVFRAPNGLQGINSLAQTVERIVEVQEAIGSNTDPDLQTLKGFILWRTANDKVLEHFGASCFAVASGTVVNFFFRDAVHFVIPLDTPPGASPMQIDEGGNAIPVGQLRSQIVTGPSGAVIKYQCGIHFGGMTGEIRIS